MGVGGLPIEASHHLARLASPRYNLSKSQATFSLYDGRLSLALVRANVRAGCSVQYPFKTPKPAILCALCYNNIQFTT